MTHRQSAGGYLRAGEKMKIWRVDTEHRTVTQEPVPPDWEHLGGRGLIARILLDEVPPACDPLGPQNRLVFAAGHLSGHSLSSCDRISIGAKSPLTGGIKESNAGGTTGLHLALLGIKAFILSGAPTDGDLQVLHLSLAGARFEPAGELAGLGTYACARRLRDKFGPRAGVALIGPAGERRLPAAGVCNLDSEGRPSRISGRGGMGAVMAAKGLKAVVIDSTGCDRPAQADPEAFQLARKTFHDALLNHPVVAGWREYGTAGNVAVTNMLGTFPTRNFSRGTFENAEEISGEKLNELTRSRPKPSTPTHNCMPGCLVRCSNVFTDEEGEEIVAPLEYETIGLLGGNLEIGSLETIGLLNRYANDLGLDSIELGAALGLAAEAGLMKFGDGEKAAALVQEIYADTPLGRLLGSGAAMTGKALGGRRIPVVKGQAIPAYDPRTLKGTGVTYATSPQGADHTAGFTLRAKVDHLDPQANVNASRAAQIGVAAVDSLGACSFAGVGFGAAPTVLRDLLNSIYGWNVPDTVQQDMGKAVLSMEREFNRQAGFTAADDRLPEFFCSEPLPPKNAIFDVSPEELDSIFNW